MGHLFLVLFATATLVVVSGICITCVMFALSRDGSPLVPATPPGYLVVFVLPCLDEGQVLEASLERLTQLDGADYRVLVVDDGSDDATLDIASRFETRGTWVMHRERPDARRGKGHALNAAYHQVVSRTSGRWDPDCVILCVLDADGRVEDNIMTEVLPLFSDASVGGVQTGVRMFNRRESLLARFQDVEFVAFIDIFQRGRNLVGTPGMGGNGQFTRLSALQALAARPEAADGPWTDNLTEDLDLGVRLLASGWRTMFCPTTWVSQEAVATVSHLVRQRTRWAQGILQTWCRLPEIWRSEALVFRQKVDLTYQLAGPLLIGFMSLFVAWFFVRLGMWLAADPAGIVAWATSYWGLLVVAFYLVTFGTAWPIAYALWVNDSDTTALRALALAHGYAFYSYLWYLTTWKAAFRLVGGRTAWSKTLRTSGPDQPPATVGGS
ncbi:MAG: glycosyltransferase family 2 protein [Acidimicrobiia bacterium]|nr:glycosyltransferase family 2 protein [Acidimicrobiia bacterium]